MTQDEFIYRIIKIKLDAADKLVEEMTPVFDKGDLVRHTLTDYSDKYIIAHRSFDLDTRIIYYESDDRSYSYPSTELELVQKKEAMR